MELRHLDVHRFVIEECRHLANSCTAKCGCISLTLSRYLSCTGRNNIQYKYYKICFGIIYACRVSDERFGCKLCNRSLGVHETKWTSHVDIAQPCTSSANQLRQDKTNDYEPVLLLVLLSISSPNWPGPIFNPLPGRGFSGFTHSLRICLYVCETMQAQVLSFFTRKTNEKHTLKSGGSHERTGNTNMQRSQCKSESKILV